MYLRINMRAYIHMCLLCVYTHIRAQDTPLKNFIPISDLQVCCVDMFEFNTVRLMIMLLGDIFFIWS